MSYRIIEYRGDHSLYHNRPEIGLVPGLGGFNLEFTNSDHHINSLIVGGIATDGTTDDFDSYLLGMSDADHASLLGTGDPVNLWAKYYSVGAGPTLTVSGSARRNASATQRIAVLDRHDLFYLRGFSISAQRSSNHNLRRLAIRYNRSDNTITVAFHDDSPGDDEFTFSILYSIVRHADATGRHRGRYFEGPFEQNFEFTNTRQIAKVVPGLSILSGFDFSFQDHDHHIRKIAIDPISTTHFDVTFTDDERDNQVSGFIEYITVLHALR